MRWRKAICWLVLWALAPALCGAAVRLQTRTNHVFAADGIEIANDFSGARISGCERLSPRFYRIDVRPENQPINTSPWYAFRLRAKQATEVTVTLDYGGSRHRYCPKMDDGSGWRRLPQEAVAVSNHGTRATMTFMATTNWLRVAGQEMIGIEELGEWRRGLGGKESVIGKSLGGREIFGTELGSASATNLVVIISRQHPPEVTGSIGLMSFVERVMEDKSFMENVGILLVPLLNPDGVHEGHWRHNLNGVDLNRDWKHFRQPETRATRDWILRRVRERGGRVLLMLDFHSTHNDVFYTQEDKHATVPPDFTRRWLTAIDERLPQYKVRRVSSHNTGKGTSKGWGYEQFGCPAITYEFGDETDRDLIRRQTTVAAEEMSRLLLEFSQNNSRGRL